MGVTVNGFTIVNEEPDLDEFFRQHVVTQEFYEAAGGFTSMPGRVWAVARNIEDKKDEIKSLTAFFAEVTKGMTQKLSVEVAGLENYNRALASLNLQPGFPLPEPVPAAIRV